MLIVTPDSVPSHDVIAMLGKIQQLQLAGPREVRRGSWSR